MPQFQGSLGPMQDLEASRTPGPAEPLKNASAGASDGVGSKDRANLGKVTRYGPHAYRDDCVCRECRKARMLERRSMEPLTRTDKLHILGVVCASISILALFALAWMASA